MEEINWDAPADEITTAAAMVAENTKDMLLVTWTKGLRDGMEIAAKICDFVIEQIALNDPQDVTVLDSTTAKVVADQIRLAALSVERPRG